MLYDIIPVTFYANMQHPSFEKDFNEFIRTFNKFEKMGTREN